MAHRTYVGLEVSDAQAFLESLAALEDEVANARTPEEHDRVRLATIALFRHTGYVEIAAWAEEEFQGTHVVADLGMTVEDHVARGRYFREFARQLYLDQ